jgi:hypothetical protein
VEKWNLGGGGGILKEIELSNLMLFAVAKHIICMNNSKECLNSRLKQNLILLTLETDTAATVVMLI